MTHFTQVAVNPLDQVHARVAQFARHGEGRHGSPAVERLQPGGCIAVAEVFENPLMNNALRCVGYIGATVQAGVSPAMALAWHFRFARYLTQVFGEHRGVYDRCVVPFFQAYWEAAVARSRFRFRAQVQLERSLAGASDDPSRRRLQRVLTVVADSLGVPVEAGTREWLRRG